ncbi:MAG: outer membrane lipoprotein carrier protein LolA [Acidobacteriota bacterium]
MTPRDPLFRRADGGPRRAHRPHPRLPSVAIAIALVAACMHLGGGIRAAGATSPWSLLEDLRSGLETAGPITARFEQTYVPAGFSSGDTESGHLSLWLPDCLRWNYEKPEQKSFLLCKGEVYAWSPQEDGGRHYRIDPSQEPGLDLLLVAVPKLQERYVASSERFDDGTYEIELEVPPDVAEGFSARIRVDPVAERVVALEYTDGEGNKTRFAITGYQDLAHTALFQPPKDIQWTEE